MTLTLLQNLGSSKYHFNAALKSKRVNLLLANDNALVAFSALTLMVQWQEGRPACKKMGDDGGGHWLVQMEWRSAGWSVCLPLLIFHCTIKSRSSLLASAHLGRPGKRAVKRLWWWWWCSNDSEVRGKPLQLGRTYHRRRTLRKTKTTGKVMENHIGKYMIRQTVSTQPHHSECRHAITASHLEYLP